MQHSPVIKWSLIIGIVIVINLFFNYLISLVYESPKYENYCKQEQIVDYNTKEACVAVGGQWNGSNGAVEINSTPKGYCDPYFTCQKQFNDVNEVYNRNVFIALVVLGVILLALSFILAFNNLISVSFAMGGILSIIIASIRYWSDANDVVHVLILFLALCALIYFAVKKFKN
jgi:hypothetical protein